MTIELVSYVTNTFSALVNGVWQNEPPVKSKNKVVCQDHEQLKSELLKIMKSSRDYNTQNKNLRT